MGIFFIWLFRIVVTAIVVVILFTIGEAVDNGFIILLAIVLAILGIIWSFKL